jgi:cyclopropane-fatty-acyl-phospholipid synthase
MTSSLELSHFQNYFPFIGNLNEKKQIAYKTTRLATLIFNQIQMAVAESYINGLEVPDSVLITLFDRTMPILFRYFPSLLVPYEWVLKEADNLAEGSQELMKVQYDLPLKMFVLMLEEGKLIYPKYSVGLWERGATTLLQAQQDMLDDLIEKVDIQDGDEILDIGCGWGCAANYLLAKFPNAKVTGLNLSREQCNYIRQKMREPESYLSSARFTLCEVDFNEVTFEKKFDKIITLGVFEHIGNLTRSLQKLASFLKADGKAFIHIMTIKTPTNVSSVFTHKYIFPYGRFWQYDAILLCKSPLKTIDRWYINGRNYAKTYTAWLNNFDRHQEKIQKLDFGIDYQKFRRMWRFYLLWFARNFASCNGEYNGNGQYLLVHQ